MIRRADWPERFAAAAEAQAAACETLATLLRQVREALAQGDPSSVEPLLTGARELVERVHRAPCPAVPGRVGGARRVRRAVERLQDALEALLRERAILWASVRHGQMVTEQLLRAAGAVEGYGPGRTLEAAGRAVHRA